MGHNFGVWGGCFSYVSKMKSFLAFSAVSPLFPRDGKLILCCWVHWKQGFTFLVLLGAILSPSHSWGLLGVFPLRFMLFPHCSIPKKSLVCCLVVREPQFPDLWVNGGRICSCYAQKRFWCSDLQFGGLWWSSCSHIGQERFLELDLFC